MNFRFQNKSEIDLSDLSNQSPLIDKEELLQNLRESLVLSNIAKKFAIAQQINAVDSYCIFAKMDVFPLALLGSQIMYFARHSILRQPFLSQISSVAVVIVVLTFVGLAFEKAIEAFRIRKADALTAGIGKEYMEGGIEFLEKEMKRNQVMRKLVPGDADKYDENGDVTRIGLDVPLRLRLKEMKRIKEECLKEEEQEKEQNNKSAESEDH